MLVSGAGRAAAADALVQAAHEVADHLGARPLRAELEAVARRARIDLVGPDVATRRRILSCGSSSSRHASSTF